MKNLISFLLVAALGSALFLSNAHAQTIYNQPANSIAQIVGGPGASIYAPTYASAVAVSPIGNAVCVLNGVNATSATCTVTASGVGQSGQIFIVICNDTGGVTYTFSTGFKATATVNPTTGKVIVVAFISDGTYLREFARSASAQ